MNAAQLSSLQTFVSDQAVALPKSAIVAAERELDANLRIVREQLAWARFGTIGFDAYLSEVVTEESVSLTLPVLGADWLALLNG